MSEPICLHCVAEVQLFKRYWNLSAGTELQKCNCLSSVATYLPALCCRGAAVKAVSQPTCWHCVAGMKLFKQCPNLLAGTVLQGCSCLSDVGTYLPALRCRGAGCLSCVGTYLQGTLLQGCRLFKWCRNLPPGTVMQWYRLFKWGLNLPPWHCRAGVQVG